MGLRMVRPAWSSSVGQAVEGTIPSQLGWVSEAVDADDVVGDVHGADSRAVCLSLVVGVTLVAAAFFVLFTVVSPSAGRVSFHRLAPTRQNETSEISRTLAGHNQNVLSFLAWGCDGCLFYICGGSRLAVHVALSCTGFWLGKVAETRRVRDLVVVVVPVERCGRPIGVRQ